MDYLTTQAVGFKLCNQFIINKGCFLNFVQRKKKNKKKRTTPKKNTKHRKSFKENDAKILIALCVLPVFN